MAGDGTADADVIRRLAGQYFNPDYYLAQNPDVKAAGVDPYLHYVQYGAAEGRNPSSYFDTNAYDAANPDVVAAGVNPLEHYIQYGQQEGRPHGGLLTPAENLLQRKKDITSALGGISTASLIPNSAGEDVISSILSGRSAADNYLNTLRSRGLINDFGVSNATKDIDKRATDAKSRLEAMRSQLLATGRSQVNDSVNRYKTNVDTYAGDPSFSTDSIARTVSDLANSFINNLGSTLRQGNDNLFSLSGLAGLAGAPRGNYTPTGAPFSGSGGVTVPSGSDYTGTAPNDQTKKNVIF